MSLPLPGSPQAPKYWVDEVSGELMLAVQSYLNGREMTVREISLMRAYLRQWVDSPVWDMNPHEDDAGRQWLQELRQRVKAIASRRHIADCLWIMEERGMDPL